MTSTHDESVTVPHGLMFHHFHGSGHPEVQGSIGAKDLERIIDFVGEDRILDPSEWLDRLRRGALQPTDRCLTFDDSLLCQFDVAWPTLEDRGLRAFWFVYSGVFEGGLERLEIYRTFRTRFFETVEAFYDAFFERIADAGFDDRAEEVLSSQAIEAKLRRFPFYTARDVEFRLVRDEALDRHEYEQILDGMITDRGLSLEDLAKDLWMQDEHLRTLTDAGHEIGLHSYSHPTKLAQLSVKKQREEYDRNRRHLQSVTGQDPVTVGHPAGSYDARTLEILKQMGVRCGFRSNMAPVGPDGDRNPSPLEIAREDHSNLLRRIAAEDAETPGQDRSNDP